MRASAGSRKRPKNRTAEPCRRDSRFDQRPGRHQLSGLHRRLLRHEAGPRSGDRSTDRRAAAVRRSGPHGHRRLRRPPARGALRLEQRPRPSAPRSRGRQTAAGQGAAAGSVRAFAREKPDNRRREPLSGAQDARRDAARGTANLGQKTLAELLEWAPRHGIRVVKRPQPRNIPVAFLEVDDMEVNALTSSDGLRDPEVVVQTARDFTLSAHANLEVPIADPFELLANKLAVRRS